MYDSQVKANEIAEYEQVSVTVTTVAAVHLASRKLDIRVYMKEKHRVEFPIYAVINTDNYECSVVQFVDMLEDIMHLVY